MKIIIDSEDSFVLFFNNFNEKIDLNDNIEETFKKIFLRLKKYYDIEIYGFYNIIVYTDEYYGVILKAIKDKELDLFYNQIDMHVIIEKCCFLYEVKDILLYKDMFDKINIYYHNNYFYIELKQKLKSKEMLKLIENSNIIYNEEVSKIKKNNKRIICNHMDNMI